MSGISKERSDNTLAIISASCVPRSPFRSAAAQYRYIGSSRRRAYGAMWASRPTEESAAPAPRRARCPHRAGTLRQMPGVRGPGACPRRVPSHPGENAGGQAPGPRGKPLRRGLSRDTSPVRGGIEKTLPGHQAGERCVQKNYLWSTEYICSMRQSILSL